MIVSQTTSVVEELCSTVVVKDHHSFASPPPDSITPHVSRFQTVVRCSETLVAVATEPVPPSISLPCIRSGSFAHIGSRRTMEDEHICIDDLSSCLGPAFKWAGAFYAVFDGHGGSAAASYVKRNAMRLFFQDVDLPETCSTIDAYFLDQLVNCHRKAFLLADVALAAESSVSSTCGTTALTALVIGRHLLIANAGDCRAVLCRKGVAVDMSQDHRPSYLPERQRVVEAGGYVDDEDYVNGELSVTRALGDWFMKLPFGSASPLIADPDVRQVMLTEDDEFLIIGCDGIWDVLPSQAAVSLVRCGLRRHDDPDMCARELVLEASRLDSNDNLTAVVICFSLPRPSEPCPPQRRRLRFSGLSEEARSRLKSLLEGN